VHVPTVVVVGSVSVTQAPDDDALIRTHAHTNHARQF
jgi:hypothetical protein